jgi:hypothetical protein
MWLTMIGLGKIGGNKLRRLRVDDTAGGAHRRENGYRLLSTTGKAVGSHVVKPSGDQK